MRTSSSINIQLPTPITQAEYLLLDEHFIITEQSTLITHKANH